VHHPVLRDAEQRPDVDVALNRESERKVTPDRVNVAASVALSQDVARLREAATIRCVARSVMPLFANETSRPDRRLTVVNTRDQN
jgi:hypothetical protein